MQDDFGSMIPERRSSDIKLDLLEHRVERLEAQLRDNTELTKAINANTTEIVDIVTAVKGGLRVLEAIGKLAKMLVWIGLLGAFFTSVWDGIRPSLASHFPRIFN